MEAGDVPASEGIEVAPMSVGETVETRRAWAVVVFNAPRRRWLYAVASDGCVAVYFHRRDAWAFARELRSQLKAKVQTVSVRVRFC